MAGFRTALKSVSVYEEPNGSAAVENTSVASNFAPVRFTSATATGAEEALPDETAVQSLHQRRQVRKGFRSGTIEISGQIVPLATGLTSGAAPSPDALSTILDTTLGGGASAAAGSAVASSPSPSTTGFTVTAGHGSRFTRGTWVAVETSAGSNVYEANIVKGVSTDALTFSWAFSFTPASTAKVINSESFVLTQGLPSTTKSLQFYVRGENSLSNHLMLGCQGPLQVEWALGQFPTWSLSASAMSFLTESEMVDAQGAVASVSMPGGSPVPVTTGAVILSPISGTLRTRPIVSEIKWSLGSTWQAEPSYNGIQGKAQQVMVRGEQATCSMLVRAEDRAWDAVWTAGTKYRIAQHAGNTAGGMVAIAFGTAELIARPVLESPNGIDYWRLTWGALMNEDAGAQTIESARSPFVIGRL